MQMIDFRLVKAIKKKNFKKAFQIQKKNKLIKHNRKSIKSKHSIQMKIIIKKKSINVHQNKIKTKM